MNISNTMQAWGSNVYSAASTAGTSIKGYANSAIEQGKMGYNKTVSLIKDNPRAAIITGLALVATGAAIALANTDMSNVTNYFGGQNATAASHEA